MDHIYRAELLGLTDTLTLAAATMSYDDAVHGRGVWPELPVADKRSVLSHLMTMFAATEDYARCAVLRDMLAQLHNDGHGPEGKDAIDAGRDRLCVHVGKPCGIDPRG